MAAVKCPKCRQKVEYLAGPRNGTHREKRCDACGADLRWDAPADSRRANRSGPPQECQHVDLRREGASVPLFWST